MKHGMDRPFDADAFSRDKYSISGSNPDRLASRKKIYDPELNFDRLTPGHGYDLSGMNNFSKKPSISPGLGEPREASIKSEVEPQPRSKDIFPIQFK